MAAWGWDNVPVRVHFTRVSAASCYPSPCCSTKACTTASLVDSAGKATITAYRFAHTIGTQLAEGGARIQTIMAVLRHRTPNMSIIYAALSDPTVKQQHQDALDRHLGPDVTLAGPAADALREHRLDPDAVS